MHPPSNVYCPFCGVILFQDPYSNDSSSPQTQVRPWYAEVRGIHFSQSLGAASLTGLGIVRRRNRLYAPLESNLSYIGADIQDLEELQIYDVSDGQWCFGFHNSCWGLLLLRIGLGQKIDARREADIAERLFKQLSCIPCIGGSIFQFGHAYEGATKVHKPFGRPNPIDPNSQFYADPCDIVSLSKLEADAISLHNPEGQLGQTTDVGHYNSQDIASSSSPSADETTSLCSTRDMRRGPREDLGTIPIFDRLSPELICEILCYLPFDQLLKLRLVCRSLAFIGRTSHLPQAYWRSRFCIGQELDFLFPNLSEIRNWHRLFSATSRQLRNSDMALLNRKRVRGLLEPIAALLHLDTVLNHDPYGSAVHLVPEKSDEFHFSDGKGLRESSFLVTISISFSGQIQENSSGPLEEGCRELQRRAQPLTPWPLSRNRRIAISQIQLGTRKYISGINLFPGENCNKSGHGIGYCTPDSEEWTTVQDTARLQAIHVAFRSEGLTATKFVFDDSSSTEWFGDTKSPGVAFGSLFVQQDSEWSCLVAGLDNYKIVSLGLGERIASSTDSVDESGHLADDINAPSIFSSLWTPNIPEEKDLKLGTLLPSQPLDVFEPLINVDFGGPKGIRLGELTRLTCYMTSGYRPLIGIEVFYADGTSFLYSSGGGCEISFFLNGPAGERIHQVGIVEKKSGDDSEIPLSGLQLSTNYGRSASFIPLRDRVNEPIKQIPIAPPGHSITGLVATERGCFNASSGLDHPLQGRWDGFVRIGIQSQPCGSKSIQTTRPPVFGDIPNDQLQFDGKFAYFNDGSVPGTYQTYASLKNVHKIKASIGMHGRSRSPHCISGLKIEYFDDQAPMVVGQWMNEMELVFELSPGETVECLSIWLTPVGFSREAPALEICQVTAIHIETTCSREIMFRAPSDEARKMELNQWRANFGEEVIALSWILNLDSDRLRAVLSSNTNQRTQIMVPELYPPFNQVQKLFFVTSDNNGSLQTAVAVKAYFRDSEIVGIAFIYNSGWIARVGDKENTSQQTFAFPRGARVVGLSVTVKGQRMREIDLEMEVEMGLNVQPVSQSLKVSAGSSHDGVTDTFTGHNWRDVWCKDAITAEGHEKPGGVDKVFKPPLNSKLVGISVGCLQFCSVGAVYEPDVQHDIST